MVTIPPELVNPDAKYIQFVYLPQRYSDFPTSVVTRSDGTQQHPLAETFPPSGEFDPSLNDVERDLSQRIPDTTGEYMLSKLLSKEDADRYKLNPNHPDFKRAPKWTTKGGTEVTPQFEFERAKFDNHLCPNCPDLPDAVSYPIEWLEHASRVARDTENPSGCTNCFRCQTFETRAKDNRSLTIVCETEGKML